MDTTLVKQEKEACSESKPKHMCLKLISSWSIALPLLALFATMLAYSGLSSSLRSNMGNSQFDRELTFKDIFEPKDYGAGQIADDCVDATLTLTTDKYPDDIYWEVVDSKGATIAALPIDTILEPFTESSFNLGCLDRNECYSFNITDNFGDGICCASGNGFYSIGFGDLTQVERSGQYGPGESVTFGGENCPLSAPTTSAPTVPPTPYPTTAPISTAPTWKSECSLPLVGANLFLTSDDYPEEISWELKDSQGIIVASVPFSSGLLGNSTQTAVDLGCLDPNDCYTFTILDSYRDGICCLNGFGSYRIQLDGATQVEHNGQYGFGESVTFGNSAACPPPGFKITLVDMTSGGGADPKYAAAFEEATARWEEIITNDLPDVPANRFDWFHRFFFPNLPYTQPIDDLVIGFSMGHIDGLEGILGQAGCVAGSEFRCLAGVMKFEAVDFATYDIEDVKIIILHEMMGHILGAVGTSGTCVDSCEAGQSYSYRCVNAVREYNELSTGIPLRLENEGGDGTKCAHWEEDSFPGNSSELMTGYFEADRYQPISRVTLGALDDLGIYTINYDAADDWPFEPLSSARTGRKVFQSKGNFYLPSLMRDLGPGNKGEEEEQRQKSGP